MNEHPAQPIGRRAGEPGGSSRPHLRPALLAPYRDLSKLRYDYPLILSSDIEEDTFVRSLSDVVDGVLQQIAPPGIAGERLRQHVLLLEARIRAMASRGARGSLGELWDLAARELIRGSDKDSRTLLEDSLGRARSALRVDGPVVDCVDDSPSEILKHAWGTLHAQRVRATLVEIAELETKLSEILELDFLNSDEGRSPERLQRSVAGCCEDAFDFEAWSRILSESSRRSRLPESRRRRIREALSVLGSQRFFAAEVTTVDRPPPHAFAFESCELAIAAFRERLAEMVDLIKAITIAKLEIDNHYRESKHDDFFRRFDESSLEPDDVLRFPSYLICLRAKDCTAQERAAIFELLSSDLPIKVLVQSDDILSESMHSRGPASLGTGAEHMASMAVALGNTYVLQAASSSLYPLSDRIREGLDCPGPALFSIFCGSGETLPQLPPYLRAAVATQSRAFPTFRYDPTAGESWALRLDLDENPQPEHDWPLMHFEYQDEALQRIADEVAFTFVDFAAADQRYADHVETIGRSDWNADMIPVWRYLELDEQEARGKVPYILTVDADDGLHRGVVDRVLIRAAHRCIERWRSLQQLGGIGDSPASQPSEGERAAEDSEVELLREEPAPQLDESGGESPAEQQQTLPASEAEGAQNPDEPYIETPRCTTCDECTQINPRMFAYNENRQAYIADPDAGSYRELVEAAETCQVSIIHPGKPRNPREPGLPELIGRAEPFR